MVITFREPKCIRKVFKKKKDVTLTVLEPIRPPKDGNQVYNEMKKCCFLGRGQKTAKNKTLGN